MPNGNSPALACLDAFTGAFNARDPAGMDAQLHFPHVIMTGGALTVWKAPGQLPLSFFDDLSATGWARSTYHDRQVVLAGADKLHVRVDYSRDRADGSEISRHAGLWILTREAGRWGIKARSS